MKSNKSAWAVLILVVLAGFASVHETRTVNAASPATTVAATDSELGRHLVSSQQEGAPSPPMMWTENFSMFMIPVPQNPDEDKTSYLVDWGDGTSTGWIGPYDPGATVTVSHVWSNEGTFPVAITAKNQDGVSDTAMYALYLSSDLKYFFVSLGYVSIAYLLTLHVTGGVYYLFDWGDGTYSDWLGPLDPVIAQHPWDAPGVYDVRWKTRDINGSESTWSDPFLVTIAVPGVSPPTFEGPSWGIVNVAYTFTITVPDDWSSFYFLYSWDDGNISDWLGPYTPGHYNLSHAWSQSGEYRIRVRLKDPFGQEILLTHGITIYHLKRAFIYGSYSNRSAGDGYVIIHAVNLHLLLFGSPWLLHDTAGENVTFFTAPLKTVLVTPRFIVGFIRLVF